MEKTRYEKAVEKHGEGMNCAQAVLASLCDKTGLNEFDSRKIAACFGGGVRCGELCGAAAGAAMALGCSIARDGKGSKDSVSAEVINEFTESFKSEFDTLRCSELLEKNGRGACNSYIGFAATEAEKIIDMKKKDE